MAKQNFHKITTLYDNYVDNFVIIYKWSEAEVLHFKMQHCITNLKISKLFFVVFIYVHVTYTWWQFLYSQFKYLVTGEPMKVLEVFAQYGAGVSVIEQSLST